MPSLIYYTDNDAMIAEAAYYANEKGIKADLNLNAKANINLEN